MKASKYIHDRLMQLKTHLNDIEATIKTKQRLPALAFRDEIEADNNEQEIEELQDLMFSYQNLIVKYESVYEIY